MKDLHEFEVLGGAFDGKRINTHQEDYVCLFGKGTEIDIIAVIIGEPEDWQPTPATLAEHNNIAIYRRSGKLYVLKETLK